MKNTGLVLFLTMYCLALVHAQDMTAGPADTTAPNPKLTQVHSFLDSMKVDVEDIKQRSFDYINSMALNFVKPSVSPKDLQWGNTAISYNNYYSTGQDLQFQGESFMQEMTVSQKISVRQLPLAVNARFRSIDPNDLSRIDKTFNVQFDYRTFIDNLINSDKVLKMIEKNNNIQFSQWANDKKKGLEDYLLTKGVQSILSDTAISNKEKMYKDILHKADSLYQYKERLNKDTLISAAQNLELTRQLEDSITAFKNIAESATKYLGYLDSLKAFYRQNINKMDVREQAGQNIMGLKKDAEDQKDEIVSKLRKSKVLSKTEQILAGFEQLSIGNNVLNESDFTARQMFINGLSMTYNTGEQRFTLHAGVLQKLRNALDLRFNQFNNLSASGKYMMLKTAALNPRSDLQYAVALQYVRTNESTGLSNNNYVAGVIFGNNPDSRLEYGGEVAYSILRSEADPAEKHTDINTLSRSAAIRLNAKYALFKSIKLLAQFQSIGADFTTLANPLLINNRYITEAGVESRIGRKIEAKVCYQFGNRLSETGRQVAPFSRFNANVNYYLSRHFTLMLNYAPLTFYENSLTQKSVAESNFYSLNLLYTVKNDQINIEENVGCSNLKSQFNNTDTVLINRTNYIMNQGKINIRDQWTVVHYFNLGIEQNQKDYFDMEVDCNKKIRKNLQIGGVYTFTDSQLVPNSHGLGADIAFQYKKYISLAIKYILRKNIHTPDLPYAHFAQTQLNILF